MQSGLMRRLGAALVAVVALAAAATGAARAADAAPQYGFVGAEVQPVTLDEARALGLDSAQGVFVRDLLSWGPAYAAGLRRGDVVTRYDGVAVSGLSHIVALVQAREPGDSVPAVVHRRGDDVAVDITLGSFPDGWTVATESVAVLPNLGLRLRALTPEALEKAGLRWGSRGLLVVGVDPGSVAAGAGLAAGEVLVAADRMPLTDPADAEALIGDAAVLLVEGARGYRAVRLDGAPLAAVRTAAGAAWQPLPGQGLLVLDIAHDTPAAAAGLRPGDLVTAVEGKPADGAKTIAGRLTVDPLGDDPEAVTLASKAGAPPQPAAASVPFLGARVAALSPDVVQAQGLRPSARGVAVTVVEPGGRAAAMGLRPGLVVAAVNQHPVTAPADLAAALARAEERGAAHALLLLEGPQGFRLVALPMAGTATVAAPPAAPPLLKWNGDPSAE